MIRISKWFPVADGRAALQVLLEAHCDLLLTDLEMPNLDGLQLAAAVRELPMYRFLPVLILDPAAPRLRAGARRESPGWIVKPTDSEHLRRWIRRSLPQ